MLTVKQVISSEKRLNSDGKEFYLSIVILDDDEEYSVANNRPAKVGDQVMAWYSDKWDKPVAKYPNQP